MTNQLTKREQVALAMMPHIHDMWHGLDAHYTNIANESFRAADAFLAESEKRVLRFTGRDSSSKALAEIYKIVDKLAENPLYLADTAGISELCQIARIAGEVTREVKEQPEATPTHHVPLAISREFHRTVDDFLVGLAYDYRPPTLTNAINAHAAALANATPDPAQEALQNLLAIIHVDGGHHTAEHGITKSIEDAKVKVMAMAEALRPFAEAAAVYTPWHHVSIHKEHCRRAKEALEGK